MGAGQLRAHDAVAHPTRLGSVHLGTVSVVEWRLRDGATWFPFAPNAHRMHVHLVRQGSLGRRTGDVGRGAVTTMLGAGRAFFTRGDAQHEFTARSDVRVVTLSVPLELFDSQPALGACEPAIVAADSALLGPIADFVLRAVTTEATELSGIGHYYLERMLQEMAVALSIESATQRAVAWAPDLFTRARTLIAAQCGDPEFGSVALAGDLAISVRQLERIFRDHETSIGRELRRARVEQAVTLLRSADYDALTITQIANHSGFSAGSSLARAMAALGYPPPARVRATRAVEASTAVNA